MTDVIDWEQYRYGKSIDCTFTPRPEWRGAGIKTGLEAFIGKRMKLQVCWKCDHDEKYPCEYALEPADESTARMFYSIPITWIASGDVTPVPVIKLEDLVVVTCDHEYKPSKILEIPYVLGKRATESDTATFHEAICSHWRFLNATSSYYDAFYPASGRRRGVFNVSRPVSGGIYLTAGERDDLYCKGLNAIHFMPGYGFVPISAWLWQDGKYAETYNPTLSHERQQEESIAFATLHGLRYHNVDLTYPKPQVG